MQPQRRDVIGTLLDASLVSLCCAYAHWLEAHKEYEPFHTWMEVAAGVGLCLGQAEAQHRLARTPYRLAVWRAFFLGAAPIVVGEIKQHWEAEREEKNHVPPIPPAPRYRDLTQ